ncbi:hypothetical protein [uncultured Phycicoccus sp.]|uniref:hypothetical protein n=1 Tax=uncultured Phycicoccus sp. TaxID=661422 RepID=UPI002613FEE1|nr:hypothetical protein [uncultured Phycicoccus sp.]
MTEPLTGGAGSAEAGPAPPSVRGDGPGGVVDSVPPEATLEVDRIRRRWSELTLEKAAAAAPAVRGVVEAVARRTAPEAAVGDLGPAVLPDQLAVVVWDAYAAGLGDGIVDLLAEARRTLP